MCQRQGEAIAVMYQTRWHGILHLTPHASRGNANWIFKPYITTPLTFRRMDPITNIKRKYHQLYINAADSKIASVKAEHHRLGSYRLVAGDVYRPFGTILLNIPSDPGKSVGSSATPTPSCLTSHLPLIIWPSTSPAAHGAS